MWSLKSDGSRKLIITYNAFLFVMTISERIKNRKDDYLLMRNNPSQNLKVKVTQLCPTLCDLMDYTVHGILQAKILE